MLLCLPGAHLGIGASCIPQQNARKSFLYMNTKQDPAVKPKNSQAQTFPRFSKGSANARTL